MYGVRISSYLCLVNYFLLMSDINRFQDSWWKNFESQSFNFNFIFLFCISDFEFFFFFFEIRFGKINEIYVLRIRSPKIMVWCIFIYEIGFNSGYLKKSKIKYNKWCNKFFFRKISFLKLQYHRLLVMSTSLLLCGALRFHIGQFSFCFDSWQKRLL